MTKFACLNDNTVRLVQSPPVITDVLPTATYALKITPDGELYLEQIEDFSMPDRLFGSIARTAERVVNTYTDRTGVTGMLLTGEKGSGKTLLGKKVALDLKATYDMPIIVVNMPISGDSFGIFLQKLGKPVTLFFDEFEKTYNREEFQNGMLTVLDGVYPVKMMAILTANDQSKMIAPLIDRPGRVYYKIDYKGLEYAFIMEYAESKLVNKEHLRELGRLATMADLNFDQLQALIEEMNRYDESVSQAVQLLNISVGTSSRSLKVLRMTENGVSYPQETWNAINFYGNIASLGDDDDDGDGDNVIRFGFMTPLDVSMTILEYSRGPGKMTYASEREVFPKIAYRNGDEVMPGKPNVIEFNGKSQIEVNAQGHITLLNDRGQTVTLEKSSTDYTKRF